MPSEVPLSMWPDEPEEDPAYLQEHLLTYLGNKRSLLPYFNKVLAKVKARLGKDRLRILAAFSGSGIIACCCKQHADYLVANDLEPYAALMARCYLRNRSEVELPRLGKLVAQLNADVDRAVFPVGFVEELYAPKDEDNIQLERFTVALQTVVGHASSVPEGRHARP